MLSVQPGLPFSLPSHDGTAAGGFRLEANRHRYKSRVDFSIFSGPISCAIGQEKVGTINTSRGKCILLTRTRVNAHFDISLAYNPIDSPIRSDQITGRCTGRCGNVRAELTFKCVVNFSSACGFVNFSIATHKIALVSHGVVVLTCRPH